MLGLTAWLLDTMPITLPSLAPRTIWLVPVTPPAPGRFSMITAWPSSLDNGLPMVRASASTLEPGALGTIILTGLPSAMAGNAGKTRERTSAAAVARRLGLQVLISCLRNGIDPACAPAGAGLLLAWAWRCAQRPAPGSDCLMEAIFQHSPNAG